MKKCRHHWIHLAMERYQAKLAGDWYWCNLCGAVKHCVSQKDYFGYDDNGVYIRHVGKDEEARLVNKW